MQVFNLTDVTTRVLEAAGLVNVSITVSGSIVAPGGSGELLKPSSDLARFFQCGALAYEQPAGYLKAKGLVPVQAALTPVVTDLKPVPVTTIEMDDKVEPSAEASFSTGSSDRHLSRKERKKLGR